VYPPPRLTLAAETVGRLDDQLFTGDPHGYVRSRIRVLLDAAEHHAAPTTGLLAAEFGRLLGPSSSLYTRADERTLKLQVAIDAFALRHQVAETLLRLVHAALHHQEGASYWVELSDTPTRMLEVIKENAAVLSADEDGGVERLGRLLVPESARTQARLLSAEDPVDATVELHISWINYAIALCLQQAPDLNAAHNKFKHGMVTRPQDDVLATLTLTPPKADGGVPLSALTDDEAVHLFDGITLEFLSRASTKHGTEATQLVLSTVPMVVEAAAMAHTHALVFHTLATAHFDDHEPPPGRRVPGHPGLLVGGPRPGTLRPRRPFALRFPLTLPLRGGNGPEALMFWTDGTVHSVDFGKIMHGEVFDDKAQ
jgi:hypothetical protein